jgi:Sulfotransferase family
MSSMMPKAKRPTPVACQKRYIISFVRNPYTRALSSYLDKIEPGISVQFSETRGRDVQSFEGYLRAIAKHDPRWMNPHFRPQRTNLDHPRIKYDSIFFLENLPALSQFLVKIYPNFQVATHAPHSRGANSKLREHYTDKAIELVRNFYAQDFTLFGYSENIDDAGAAPGIRITRDGILCADCEPQDLFVRPRDTASGTAFETTLRYRRFVDMGLN